MRGTLRRYFIETNMVGGRGRDRTGDPLLAKQVLSQLSYTPTNGNYLHSKAFSPIPKSVPSLFHHHCTKTVPKPPSAGAACAAPRVISLARRLSFSRASRFMANFICEYFLKTSELPCRSSWTTHSSATPPELSRVAYVERRS